MDSNRFSSARRIFLQFRLLFSFGKSEDKSGLARTEIWVTTLVVAIRSPTKQTEMTGRTQ
jgi:hypothetical protein